MEQPVLCGRIGGNDPDGRGKEPMGRAFRVVKRTTHLTVQVTEKPQVIKAVGAEEAERPQRAQKAPAKKTAAKAASAKAASAKKAKAAKA